MPIRAGGAMVAATFLISFLGCMAVRGAAKRLRLFDVPNERSLHQAPVPRLGGVAIVVAVWIAFGVGNQFAPLLDQADVVTWLAAASIVAVLGLADDLWHLPASVRFLVQVGAATICLAFILPGGSEVELAVGLRAHATRAMALAPCVLFVVGTTNIYNFMDGMDGLAATQGLTALLALAAGAAMAGQGDVALVALVITAATAGFLMLNAPPASLFLGDAGSTFLGFTFGVLALVMATRPVPVPLGVVPVALSPFLLDGTFTILRRLRRGERIWEAHRTHLYQRAVSTGLTHRHVLLVYAMWSLAAAAAALLIARSRVAGTCAIAAATLLPLGLVWRWVVRQEARAAQPLQ